MNTPVIFRQDLGETVAIFPTLGESDGRVRCYAHIGQHSACSRDWYATTTAAKPDEYTSLLKELEQIGYDDLKIYRRWFRFPEISLD